MQQDRFFPYSWHVDEKEEDVTSIRIYGLGHEADESICVCVDDFTPYVYLELPTNINWDTNKAQLLGNKLDELLGDQRPIRKALTMKKRLYGAFVNDDGEYQVFPYLFCSFSSRRDAKTIGYRLRKPIHVLTLGAIRLKIHESDADEIMQLTCCRQIPTAGWIQFHGKLKDQADMVTRCDKEYRVKWKALDPYASDRVPRPKIMGFDIEVNSTIPSAMPKAERLGDKIFQISCVICRHGDPPEKYEKYLLTLGQPDPGVVGDDVLVYMYETESQLLEGYTQFVCEENPNLIAGYNILGFDIPYMIDRAKMNMCIFTFDQQGFHKHAHAREKTIRWSSSAYKNQEFQFLDAEGRVYVDLLPLIRRDFKFNNYKLKTVTEHFIGETKDPLGPKGIFKCYRIGTKTNTDGGYSSRAQQAMGIVGKYCVQDSNLVVLLMDKLQTWVGLTEMAKTCNVPIFTLYTQGQQIKVYAQLYKFCMYENIVVEKDAYQVGEGERFVGAHVFPPVPGRYKQVVPFDFASLYPTTIIAYNIDYHTWVPDDSPIPDSRCHVMEWEDHIGCCHDPKVVRTTKLSEYITTEQANIKKLREKRVKTIDKFRKKEIAAEISRQVEELKPYIKERSELNKTKTKYPMCAKRYYRFLKEPRGILPTIIQNLLDARKRTRKVDMVNCHKRIAMLQETGKGEEEIEELNGLLGVLDKRQLAYKVSANSMYGIMGTRKGYLPFMPGAMCTTYKGRVNIELVAKTIVDKYQGELVYGDTDSNYIYFPHMRNESSATLWDYAEHVANEVTKLFPPPIKLEYEEAIYAFFFILTKKRYMYRAINSREGQVEENIGKKGVLLARRDNSKFVRDVYEGVITKVSNDVPRDDVLYWIMGEINAMFSRGKPHSDFIITKAVGDSGGLQAEAFVNEKGARKAKVGDYTVPILSSNKEEREEQLVKKGADSPREYYLLCLPAQVQLAERIKGRGQRVDAGSRLEYVVTDPDRHTAKQYEKVECAEYFIKHGGILKIDYYYYLKALSTPLDQVLNVAYGRDPDWKEDFVLNHYKCLLKNRFKFTKELNGLFKPEILFV
jgi:DNA polymerase elongation subunit (family B)